MVRNCQTVNMVIPSFLNSYFNVKLSCKIIYDLELKFKGNENPNFRLLWNAAPKHLLVFTTVG